MTPKVSVVIPNYNHARYLQQRIDSVLCQTYTDLELIILDDCSTDESKAIIETYRNEPRVSHIIYNETNSGNPFIQWNKGIELSKGEYIWIAESDDWCETIFLQTILEGLEKNDDTVFGYCQSFCVNDAGDIIFQSNYPRLGDYCSPDEYLEKFLCNGNAVFNAGMAVFKKSLYKKMSGYYLSFRFAGDWVFWAELSRMGRVYINAKPLNYFRKHADHVSGKMYASGENFIEEFRALDYFHEQLHLDGVAYFKSKVKLYGRFLSSKSKLDLAVRQKIKGLFFEKISFVQKQYFLFVSWLYQCKLLLKKKINTAF
jgi:glycosyltransferase involved in cell wall biosynthesis